MDHSILDFSVIEKLPRADRAKADELIAHSLKTFTKKVIVLDDDPTGVQTVSGISVYTDWSPESIRAGFKEHNRMFYILSNSRSFTKEETILKHTEICRNISAVSKETGCDYIIISRSDSTLRGHYPTETEVIRDELEKSSHTQIDGEILYPFFVEGGRYTLNNIHYVKEADKLVPAALTEFAKDKTFGYRNSYLPKYVEEKTGGRYKAEDVTCIALEDLRAGNINKIASQLMQVKNFNKVIVNSADYADVKMFCAALIKAINSGKRFVFRSAAAFTKVMGGVPDKALLTNKDIIDSNSKNGGLIVIGSHIRKTTEQLDELKKLENVSFIEFNQHLVLQQGGIEKEVKRVVKETSELIANGKTVAVYTRRERLDFNTGNQEDELRMATKISESITDIVRSLDVRPRFLIAKGGITSSDIGTKGLRVKRALVAGQIKPGIPVWLTGEESKFPGMAYVIFPGNVGEKQTLMEIVKELM